MYWELLIGFLVLAVVGYLISKMKNPYIGIAGNIVEIIGLAGIIILMIILYTSGFF